MATTDADLAKLSVQLELQTAEFAAGVKRMDGQLRKLDKGVDKSSKRMKILNTAVKNLKRNFVALAAAVSIGALANQPKNAMLSRPTPAPATGAPKRLAATCLPPQ